MNRLPPPATLPCFPGVTRFRFPIRRAIPAIPMFPPRPCPLPPPFAAEPPFLAFAPLFAFLVCLWLRPPDFGGQPRSLHGYTSFDLSSPDCGELYSALQPARANRDDFFACPCCHPRPSGRRWPPPERCCCAGRVESQAKCTGPQPSCLASRRSWRDREAVEVKLRPLERVGHNLELEVGVRLLLVT